MNAHKISRKDFLRFSFGLTEQSVNAKETSELSQSPKNELSDSPKNELSQSPKNELSDSPSSDNSNIHILKEMPLPPEFRSFYKKEIESSEFADEKGDIKKIEKEMLSALWNNSIFTT